MIGDTIIRWCQILTNVTGRYVKSRILQHHVWISQFWNTIFILSRLKYLHDMICNNFKVSQQIHKWYVEHVLANILRVLDRQKYC